MQGVIYRAFMASTASEVTALEPVLINLGEFFFGRLAIAKEPKLKVPAGCVANPSKFAGQFFITAISPYRVALYESKGVIGVRNMVEHIADEGYEILDGSGRIGNADAVFAHEMFQDDIRRVPDVLERVMYPFDGRATSRKKMLFSPEKRPDGRIDEPDRIDPSGIATWSVMGGKRSGMDKSNYGS